MESKKFITKFEMFCESIYESQNNAIDVVLDKINTHGIDNLTKYEKEILQNPDNNDNINNFTTKILKLKYSNLKKHEVERKSFGKLKKFIVFFNDDMEMEMEYDVLYKKLYISYDDIRNYFGEYFNEEIFKKWFMMKYNIEILKIGDYFKNIESK